LGFLNLFENIARTYLITNLEADVWKFERDLMNYLASVKELSVEEKTPSVNEVKGEIRINGDHVFQVVDFMKMKGF
jgi:translation initiation factor 1 (eIF-1/SUI1)